MRASEVFTPQKSPTLTLVTRHLETLTAQFADAVDEGGNLIRVVGPSKSGKTVFVRKVFGDDRIVPTSGAGVNHASELWTRVLDAVGSDVSQTTERNEQRKSTASGSAQVTGNILIASGTAQGSIGRERSETTAVQSVRAIDLLQLVIREFAGSGLTILIDDFHYIPAGVQIDIARQIKQAVEQGTSIVCAAVPFRSEDAIRANDDLQGRVRDFRFDYWDADALREIPTKGFPHLAITCSAAYIDRLVGEAAGSPQLMQSLCLNTCFELGVREAGGAETTVPDDPAFFRRVCLRVVGNVDFTSTIDQMKAGPLMRGRQRNSYSMRDGSIGDVYQVLVKALGSGTPSLHMRYADLVNRVSALCVSDAPPGSSISDACFHLARIANSGFPTEKIDWNPEAPLLSIRDPYLLFAMRWPA